MINAKQKFTMYWKISCCCCCCCVVVVDVVVVSEAFSLQDKFLRYRKKVVFSDSDSISIQEYI